MYKIGDDVIYSSQGVYRVVDIREETALGEVRNYYVLSESDSSSSSAVFVPVGGETEKTVLRPLMSESDALILIDRYDTIPPCEWINDTRPRAAAFKKLIDSGDRISLISLIKSIDSKQAERTREGKKPFLADEHTRERAIRLLCSELACVLSTDVKSVKERLGIL